MIISILLLVVVTAALFSGQFMSFYRTTQTRQKIASYQPLVEQLQRNKDRGIAELARRFYENNQSFEFYIADKDGGSIYATPNADTSDSYYIVLNNENFSVIAQSRTGLGLFYRE